MDDVYRPFCGGDPNVSQVMFDDPFRDHVDG